MDYNGSGMPKLVAEPYIENMSSDTDNETGVVNENALENNAFDLINDSGSSTIGDLQRLDFAHYQLNSKTIAFGIRFESKNMYPRGGVTNQSITLFAIINNKLLPIFKSKIYFSKYMAPPLDSNGSAVGHDIDEQTEYVLSILPHQTNGFFDIKQIQKGARNKTRNKKGEIYCWDSQKLSYQ